MTATSIVELDAATRSSAPGAPPSGGELAVASRVVLPPQAALPDDIDDWPAYFGRMGATYDGHAFAGCALARVAHRELDTVLAALGCARAGAVLDIGAGTARFSAPLAARGWQVTAFDGSAAMLDVVRRKVPSAALVHGRLGEPLPFEARAFDAVIAIRVVKYVRDTRSALAEMARVTNVGGRVVFDVPNGRSIARLGYRRGTIGFVDIGALRRMADEVGLRILAVDGGPRLPHPVLQRAASALAARVVARVDATISRLLGPTLGARSLLVDAVRDR